MKLRNKGTGEIDDFLFDEAITGRIDLYRRVGTSETKNIWHYNSLAELNEEWEDYTPTKPLIEDEAKRRVFKAWAEILGRDLEKADFKYDAERNGFDCYLAESIIEFASGEGINCVDREIYTFRALCGEEEE
jgi:hypothetical protein